MRVIYDLRGAQSRLHPERGIARWVTGLFQSLVDRPELSELHALVDSELPLPQAAAALGDNGRLLTPEAARLAPVASSLAIHHITSPFELDFRFFEIAPASITGPDIVRAVTLYDIIPLVYPEVHTTNFMRRWRYRSELVKTADLVLCISEFTAKDGIERLGLDERRVHVIGTGVPAQPPPRTGSLLPEGVRGSFILYAGGLEHRRKNVDALVRAVGRLRPDLRSRMSLVVVGKSEPGVRQDLLAIARSSGIADRVHFTGFVSDDELRSLYAECTCFVYPSLYEGFGLPIAEAMSLGAPVVCSSTTSCGEIAPLPEGTFDPADDDAIVGAITRVLDDSHFAEALRRRGQELARQLTWDRVAERTVAAYDAGIRRRLERRTRRGPIGALTFLSHSPPHPVTPSAAFNALAGGAGETQRVELMARYPEPVAHGMVRVLASTRSSDVPSWRAGPLVCLVDCKPALNEATRLLAKHRGVAVIWELDRLLYVADTDQLTKLAAVATRLVVRSEFDRDHLRATLEGSMAEIRVLPPPLCDFGVPVERTAGAGHVASFRHPRFGPFGPEEIALLGEIADHMPDSRIVAVGEAPTDGRAAARRLEFVSWPEPSGLADLSRRAGCMLDVSGGPRSAHEAAIDHALGCGRPIVTIAAVGESHPSIIRTTSIAGSQIAERLTALLASSHRTHDPAMMDRAPRTIADRLVGLLA